MFSYGSGMASSFFSMRISSEFGPDSALSRFTSYLSDVSSRLDRRHKVSPTQFVQTLSSREKAIDSAPYTPVGDLEQLFPGTYYLQGVDDKHRREYGRIDSVSSQNGHV